MAQACSSLPFTWETQLLGSCFSLARLWISAESVNGRCVFQICKNEKHSPSKESWAKHSAAKMSLWMYPSSTPHQSVWIHVQAQLLAMAYPWRQQVWLTHS